MLPRAHAPTVSEHDVERVEHAFRESAVCREEPRGVEREWVDAWVGLRIEQDRPVRWAVNSGLERREAEGED